MLDVSRRSSPLGKSKPKPTPLEVEQEAADAVHALFLRVANGPWWDSLRSPELADVGVREGDEPALREIISNPMYRGAIPYSSSEIAYEPYRIVDDTLWYRANAALPKTDSGRRSKNREAMDELAQLLDQAETIRAFVEAHQVRCRRCRRQLRWDGIVKRRGVRIPVLRCAGNCGYRTPLLVSEDLKTLRPRVRCYNCSASFREDFHQRYDRERKRFQLRCLRCGWECWMEASILDEIDDGPPPSPSPSARAETTSQQRLTEAPPKPHRGPGRRRPKANRRPKRPGKP